MRVLLTLFLIISIVSCNYRNSNSLNMGALKLIEAQKYNAALEKVNKGLTISPLSAKLHYTRAMIYMKQNDFLRALGDINYYIDRYNKDSKKYPKYINKLLMIDLSKKQLAKAFYYRGLFNHRLEKYDDAFKDYEQSSELGFKSSALYFNIGSIIHKKGFYNSAIRNYTKSIMIDSTAICLYNRGIAFMELGKYNKAQTDLEKSLDLGYKKASQILLYIK